MMIRTQIMLDYKTKKDLRDLAQSEGKSLSQIVRDSLKKTVKERKKKMSGVEFLGWLAKNAGHGPGDSEYDKYAYGLK